MRGRSPINRLGSVEVDIRQSDFNKNLKHLQECIYEELTKNMSPPKLHMLWGWRKMTEIRKRRKEHERKEI